MPVDFDKQEYWHHRFASETQFEWLVPSLTFMALIEPHLRSLLSSHHHMQKEEDDDDRPTSQPRILQIGFGTSDLQNHLRARGLTDVLNVDYEPLAIERGRQREKQTFGDVRLQYAVADATALDPSALPVSDRQSWGQEVSAYDDNNNNHNHNNNSNNNNTSLLFDLVLDKSTVDAVSCGGEEAFLRMVRGVRTCLAPGGCWISLSYSSTRFDCATYLDPRDFPFDVRVLAKVPTPKERASDPDIYHWCYLLTPRHA